MTQPDDDLADRTAGRADLLPEEQVVGSEDPTGQAEAVLRESDERTFDRDAAPDSTVEHRSSDDTVEPPE